MKKKTIIYGMGSFGTEIADLIMKHQKELDMEVIGLCDKRELKSSKTKTYLPSGLTGLDYDYIIITSQKWYEDIRKDLIEKYNISPDKMILFSDLYDGDEFYCNICEKNVCILWPAGSKDGIFEKKKIIGGGYRQNCLCPLCGSTDRNRWLQYVLKTETNIYDGNNKILHLAPEQGIEKRIREKNADYITADIVMGRADVEEDITNMSFADNTFDYIICNHVLEHITDEVKAINELKRCIKRSGSIILSVPICWEEPTYEDKTITLPEERLKHYGQEDHVRLYGNDFKKRLERFGFKVKRVFVDVHRHEELAKMGLIDNDSIWVLNKE